MATLVRLEWWQVVEMADYTTPCECGKCPAHKPISIVSIHRIGPNNYTVVYK